MDKGAGSNNTRRPDTLQDIDNNEPPQDFDPLADSANGELPSSALASSGDSEEHKRQRMNTPSPKPVTPQPGTSPLPSPFMVPPSPPKFVSIEEVLAAANGVTNMSLAHEIAVDSEFRLEKFEPEGDSLEKRVKEIMHKAFWDSLADDLKQEPADFTHALVLMEELRQNLLDLLLPHHKKMRTHIEEVMDMDLIRQKADHNALDFTYYAQFAISIMERLCAPVRDEQVATLKEISDIIAQYKTIFEILDLMKMDMANFTIQQMRPLIQQQSVEYERLKFKEFLKTQEENNLDGLLCTKQWITQVADKLQYIDSESGMPRAAATPREKQPTPATILNQAYIGLLDWNENVPFPETLVLDHDRFLSLKDRRQRVTLIASILLVTFNTVGPSISGISDFKAKLKDHISVILQDLPNSEVTNHMPNIAEQVRKEVEECLSKHGYPALDEKRRDLLYGQILQVKEEQHPVHSLLKTRITDFILEILSSTKPGSLKLPAGVSAVAGELNAICGPFLRLVSHNRAVFGPFYADIIASLLKRTEDISPR